MVFESVTVNVVVPLCGVPEGDVSNVPVGTLEECGVVGEVVGVFGDVRSVPAEELNVLYSQGEASYHVGETKDVAICLCVVMLFVVVLYIGCQQSQQVR